MSVPLPRRYLRARPGRALAGLGGIGAALLLVLTLQGIFAGLEDRLAAFILRSGADVVVAQRGVDTMHMTSSTLSDDAARQVTLVPGVASTTPILYRSTTIALGERRSVVYLIGERGVGNFHLASGRPPRPGEIVLDHGAMTTLKGSIGAEVTSELGLRLRVSGTIDGTASIASSVAFVTFSDLARVLQSPQTASYVLVRARSDVAADELARRIERAVPSVSATTRPRFAASERRVVSDMTTGLMRAMILIGFVVGVSVAGLVAYSATLTQLRDYAVLRALGLRSSGALGIVAIQIGALVAGGLLVALGLAWALGLLLPRLSPTLVLSLRAGDVVRALVVTVLVAIAAAAAPVLRVARIDPATAFQR